MRTIVFGLIALALGGCAVQGGTMSQEEQLRIMREVETRRQLSNEAYATYSGICFDVFPGATDMQNDGDLRFSEQGSVNVSLAEGGEHYVCSVNIAERRVDRVFVGQRALSIEEFLVLRSEKKRAPLDVAKRVAEKDAEQIAKGNYAGFVKRAKRNISDNFKDPDSAKFRDVIISKPDVPTLCGQVNAKNSYGGYVGYKLFLHNAVHSIVSDSSNAISELKFIKLYSEFCSEKIVDVE